MIYLDNNATTTPFPEVVEAVCQELMLGPANPSSIHRFGQEARIRLVKARKEVADLLGAEPHEVYFTSGGTEGAAMLLHGFLAKDLLRSQKGHILTTEVEHPCVREALKYYKTLGWDVECLPVGESGAVDVSLVKAHIRPDTSLLVFMAVNNETGAMTDLEALATLAELEGIPLVVDAVALLGKESLTLHSGITGMFFAAHKFHGPKGVGFIYLRKKAKITPLLLGGGQERGYRSGTENLAGILGMVKALELVLDNQEKTTKAIRSLRDDFEKKVFQGIEGVAINGLSERVCNTSNLSFEGVDGESLVMNLDLHGVAASHGSACSSGALEPSKVLLAMGLDIARAKSAVRFSLSRFTTQEEVDKAASVLISLVKSLR